MSTSSRVRRLLLWATFSTSVLLAKAATRKAKGEEEDDTQKADEASEIQENVVVIAGVEFNRLLVYGFTILLAVLLSVMLIETSGSSKKLKGNRPDEEGTLDVIIIGCGLPKKGMGWYHLTQLLEMPKVNVVAVVEPFFLNPKLCSDVPSSFKELVTSLNEQGVTTTASVDSLAEFSKPTMCLIAGRTPDNPNLFEQCIHKGATVIYLEKPGAPTVAQLEEMKSLADSRNVKVYLGYNKHVTRFVQNALELAGNTPEAQVVFCHNNSYKPEDLPECFARNSEGILKNMAIHELALLVSFFGVTVDTIDTFQVNPEKRFSEKLTIWKPGSSLPHPEYIADFSRVAFEVKTKDGVKVGVMADRCGGNVSWAMVKDKRGREVGKFEFPNPEEMAEFDEKIKADPEMMPYFFIQSDDYLGLKNRVVDSVLAGTDADGVATIQVGIDALKLAEYGTKALDEALEAK